MARAKKGFQPNLAGILELDKLKLPALGSPKLDGIRCIIENGRPISRKLKPIPNKYIYESLNGLPDGLDGELIVGETVGNDVWNRSQSGCMRATGEPDFRYFIFDYHCDLGFSDRLDIARRHIEDMREKYPWLVLVEHTMCDTLASLEALEEKYVAEGYEGIMVRDPKGHYKYGRSTAREGGLLKWKRFFDAEAVCIGYVERMHNTNEQERDERGYAKRSKAKDGMVGTGTLGALRCRIGVRADGTLVPSGQVPFPEEFVEFELGTGFTDEDRAALWARRDTDLIGSIHRFKYQGLTPEDRKPRIPVWLGEWFDINGGEVRRYSTRQREEVTFSEFVPVGSESGEDEITPKYI